METYPYYDIPKHYNNSCFACASLPNPSIMQSLSSSNCSSNASKESGISDLHPFLFQTILLKLPIKSIVQCRFVCKSWNQLILDPSFAKFYSENYPSTVMVVSHQRETFSFLEIGNNGEVVRTPFNMKLLNFARIGDSKLIKSKYREKRLVGSCNGLLCIVETPCSVRKNGGARYGFMNNLQKVWVINPLTGESMVMPKVKGPDSRYNVKFEFVSTIDKVYYKIIRIVDDNGARSAKILTIGVDDEWRDFDDSSFTCGFTYGLYNHGIALNGCLHWYDFGRRIRAFNIGEEIGYSIPIPPEVLGHLAVWDGHLCLIKYGWFLEPDQFNVWIMKEYGVAESWTKHITRRSLIRDIYVRATPITTKRNGDQLIFMVSRGGSILSFDMGTLECVEVIKDVYVDKQQTYSVCEHVPSFFSLGALISRQM